MREPEPAWAVRRWGVIRIIVIALAAATALGLGCFEADAFLAEKPGFWALVGVGIGAAGLVAALRMIAFPVEAVVAYEKGERGPWARSLEIILARTLADTGWLVVTIVVGVAVRSAVIVAGSGWSAGVIRSFVIAPLVGFIVFASLLIAGWLLVLASCGLVRLARMRRAGANAPASAWWSIAVVAGLALAVPATFAVGLSDTTSVSLEGGDAIGAFLFGEVWLEHPWQYFVLWIARIGTYATAISLVGVIVSRWQTRRRA